jgi:transcriptional regulator with XRE-family HTH domain
VFAPRTMGQALVFLRIKAGLTRDEACELSGITTGTLSRYENDRTGRIDMGAVARHSEALALANGFDPDDVWRILRPLLADAAASSAVLTATARSRMKKSGRRRLS